MVVLSACGQAVVSQATSGTSSLTSASQNQNYNLSRFEVVVSGGGSQTFTVVPNSTGGEFIITVTYYNYKTVNDTLVLTSSNNPAAYSLVQNIFNGSTPFVASPPSNYASGSWTNVTQTLTSGVVQTIDSPTLSLSSLENFIASGL